MNQPIELSLEQKFQLKSFANLVQRMTSEQAKEYLIMLHQQMMMRETMYQHFLRHEWNLNSGTVIK